MSKDGTGDMYYNLILIEYKEPSVENAVKESREKETNKEIENVKAYKVQSGDTLYNIAKRFYGDGNKYLELAEKNGISNPNFILDGQELKI